MGGVSIQILVRDDGSTDRTQQILNSWQEKGYLTWYTGQNLGPARSFMHLLCHAPKADYYAFCDQDDVWLPEKVSTAVSQLEQSFCNPAIYVSTYTLVDKDLNPIVRRGKTTKYSFTFGETFITSPAPGCTMVLNHTLREIVCKYEPAFIYMHDSWVYRIALAIGADLYHDSKPSILYRQHGHNVVGGKKSFARRWRNRFAHFGAGRCIRWHSTVELYNGYKDLLSEKHLSLVADCIKYKESLWNVLKFLWHKELRTPTKSFQIIFFFVVLTKRF